MTDIPATKARLEALLQQLKARAESLDHDLSEAGDDDSQEQAAEASGDEVMEGVGELALKEIGQIKRALSQIEDGKYGICTSCGGAIAKGRLEALPYATNCVECA